MRAEPRFKPLPLEAVALLGEGKLADAIKAVKQSEGIHLRDARARVATYVAQDPLLRVQIETQQGARRRRIFFWFLFIDLVVTAGIVYWLFFRGST